MPARASTLSTLLFCLPHLRPPRQRAPRHLRWVTSDEHPPGVSGERLSELVARTYRPLRTRRVEIPKGDGTKVRVLGIPAIRDRVVQGALKLILEPIFEADFHDGSYGYRPKRKAHDAVARVTKAILEGKTQVIDLDLGPARAGGFLESGRRRQFKAL